MGCAASAEASGRSSRRARKTSKRKSLGKDRLSASNHQSAVATQTSDATAEFHDITAAPVHQPQTPPPSKSAGTPKLSEFQSHHVPNAHGPRFSVAEDGPDPKSDSDEPVMPPPVLMAGPALSETSSSSRNLIDLPRAAVPADRHDVSSRLESMSTVIGRLSSSGSGSHSYQHRPPPIGNPLGPCSSSDASPDPSGRRTPQSRKGSTASGGLLARPLLGISVIDQSAALSPHPPPPQHSKHTPHRRQSGSRYDPRTNGLNRSSHRHVEASFPAQLNNAHGSTLFVDAAARSNRAGDAAAIDAADDEAGIDPALEDIEAAPARGMSMDRCTSYDLGTSLPPRPSVIASDIAGAAPAEPLTSHTLDAVRQANGTTAPYRRVVAWASSAQPAASLPPNTPLQPQAHSHNAAGRNASVASSVAGLLPPAARLRTQSIASSTF